MKCRYSTPEQFDNALTAIQSDHANAMMLFADDINEVFVELVCAHKATSMLDNPANAMQVEADASAARATRPPYIIP